MKRVSHLLATVSAVLFAACLPPPPHPEYSTRPGPEGVIVTLHALGLRVTLPAVPIVENHMGEARVASTLLLLGPYSPPSKPTSWYVGPGFDRNGRWEVRTAEIQLDAQPSADTLAEKQAVIRNECVRSEIMESASTQDGYEILYACTSKSMDAGYGYARLATIGGRHVECFDTGSLEHAKAVRGICATLEAAPGPAQAVARGAAR